MAVLLVIFIPAEDEDAPTFERHVSFQQSVHSNVDEDVNESCVSETDPLISGTENESLGGESECKDPGETKQRPADCEKTAAEDAGTADTLTVASDGCTSADNVSRSQQNTWDEDEKSSEGTSNRVKWQDSIEQATVVERLTLEEVLQKFLDDLGITTDVWDKTDDSNRWRVSVLLQTSQCDMVMHRLTQFGFGQIAETSISIFTSSSHHASSDVADGVSGSLTSPENSCAADVEKSEFMKSVKSRLTVAQVVEGVKANAQLTFDYIMLVILASIIAALGLAENSSVVLVASMLVSPIMGPILGGVFGTVIRHKDLWRLGVKNELIGLSICLLVGFFLGLIMAGVSVSGADWGSVDSWPTPEMKSRGMLRSLWVGVLIALPSGAGVALSILGGNSGSLVGVAISASLLPPAVNAGMLWASALVSLIHAPTTEASTMLDESYSTSNSSVQFTPVPPHCPSLFNNKYEFVYRCDMSAETGLLGLISLFLTVLNIICILIMGVVVLKIKEVAPHTAVSRARAAFWKTDIKVARNAYQTMKTTKESLDMAKFAREIAEEWKVKQKKADEDALNQSLKKLVHDMEVSENFQAAARSVPGGKPYSDLLATFSKECMPLISGKKADLPREQSYHTISTIGHYRKLIDKENLNNARPDVSTDGTPTPATPLTPDPSKAEKRFVFDEEQVFRRRKHHRRPRGPSRMYSSPDIKIEYLPTKSRVKRFEVETVDEKQLAC